MPGPHHGGCRIALACLPVCCPSLSWLESAALLLVSRQSARPSPSQPARSLTTLRYVPARLDSLPPTSLAAGGRHGRQGGGGRHGGRERIAAAVDPTSDSGSGGWLLRCAAGRRSPRTAARLVGAITGRPGTGGARGHKKRKKSRGSVGPSFALVRRRPEAPLPPSKSRWAAPCVAVAAQGAALLFCTPPS